MARLIAIALAALIAPMSTAGAQDTSDTAADAAPEVTRTPPAAAGDLALPPQLSNELLPGDSQIEPADEEREDLLEAVVTSGQTEFRLPDLGTSFRNDDEESLFLRLGGRAF